MEKVTAIIGASDNRARYSYIATNMLKEYGHPVLPLGIRKGNITGSDVILEWPESIESLDTVTLYVGPKRQPEVYDYVLGLRPKRIIFNPGTENPDFAARAKAKGIETVEACTLVMLRTNQY